MTLSKLATFLVGDFGAFGVGVFIGEYPETPDSVLVLRHYGADRPEFTLTGQHLQTPAIQVMVRRVTYPAAETAAHAAYDALLELRGGADLDGMNVRHLNFVQTPFYIGQDERERHRFVFNIELPIWKG